MSVSVDDIKRDDTSEYIIKEAPFERTQKINNVEYKYTAHRKYKYRLSKEKKQLRNIVINHLKTLDYTQLVKFLADNNLSN